MSSDYTKKTLRDYFQWYNYNETYSLNAPKSPESNMIDIWEEYDSMDAGDHNDREDHYTYEEEIYEGMEEDGWSHFYGIQFDEEVFDGYIEEED